MNSSATCVLNYTFCYIYNGLNGNFHRVLQFFSHPFVNLILATYVFDGFYLKLFVILFIQQKHKDLVPIYMYSFNVSRRILYNFAWSSNSKIGLLLPLHLQFIGSCWWKFSWRFRTRFRLSSTSDSLLLYNCIYVIGTVLFITIL